MTLAEFLTANLGKKFQWGEWDCVLFTGSWIALATGIDPLADLPKWTNEKQAWRIVKKLGGLEKAMDARFKRIAPNFAKDGDIALVGDRLCIFSGSQIAGPGPVGIVYVKRTEAICAWSY